MNDTLLVMLVGFGMGFFGSIPPLGPVALMIIDRAFKKELKFAFAAGVGGALAEVVYSALAVTGVGLLVRQLDEAHATLALISASILLLVGVYFLYDSIRQSSQDKAPAATPDPALLEQMTPIDAPPDESLKSSLGHLVRGFSIAIVNPILIVNWTLAVAYFFSLFRLKTDLLSQVLFAAAVGVGKILWTGIEVWLLDKFRQRYPLKLLRRVQKGVSVAVILSALLLAYRTFVGM